MGPSCDTEKLQATAQFYCFKIHNDNQMKLRVNQRNTTYRSVAAVDLKGTPLKSCDTVAFDPFEPGGIAILKITYENSSYNPSCGATKMSDKAVTWRFKFQEYPSTVSAYDVVFEVTCDFSRADTLLRHSTANSDKSSNKATKLSESKVAVSFGIIDPINKEPVTTAKLGQYIRVQMTLDNMAEQGIIAISPYNCSASTLNNEYSVIFSDHFGCEIPGAQVRFLNTSITTWQSELFEAFTFPGYDEVSFQCNFHVCFAEEEHFCQDMCSHSKKREHKNRQKMNHGQPSHLRTTLSIG